MFDIFKKLKWFIGYYKKFYVVVFVLAIVDYAILTIPPFLVGYLTDSITKKTIDLSSLFNYLLVFGIVIVVKYIIEIFWSYYLFKAGDEIQKILRFRIMDKLLKQSPFFYEKNTTGSIMGKATNDVSNIGQFAGYGVMAMIDSIIFPIPILLVMIFGVSFKLTLFSILPLPILIYLTREIGNRLYKRFDEAQKSFDMINESVLENVSGVRLVRSFTLEKRQMESFLEKANDSYNKNMEVAKLFALYSPISKIIPTFSFMIAIGYGSYLVSTSQISIGNLISFTFYLNMMIWPMFALGDYISLKEQASASADRIQEILDYAEDMIDESNVLEYQGNGDIVFDGLDFTYPSSKEPILKDIKFRLKSGQTLGILGKTGSGKTTLVKQLLRMYPIDKRKVSVGGLFVEDIRIKSLVDKIGYVPQINILFSKSIMENILMGDHTKSKEDAYRVIHDADFQKDIEQMPEGVDTLVGEKGVSISGGQKQRISIARGLIKDPEILILDDSLSAVDAATEQNILRELKRSRQGKTNIIVSHRVSAVAESDLIIVLDNGRIVQMGNHNELIGENGWYKEQFLHQSLEEDTDGK